MKSRHTSVCRARSTSIRLGSFVFNPNLVTTLSVQNYILKVANAKRIARSLSRRLAVRERGARCRGDSLGLFFKPGVAFTNLSRPSWNSQQVVESGALDGLAAFEAVGYLRGLRAGGCGR